MLVFTCNGERKRIVRIIAIVLFSIFLSVSAQAVSGPWTGQNMEGIWERSPLPDSAKLLQFKSGHHIIGFSPEKVYMASLDHALSVEFVGGRKVDPGTVSARNGEGKGGPGLLGRVEYQNQWEGITIRYDATDGGIAESTYIIKPGADVNTISLRYNVPVQSGPEGSLRFKLNSSRGWMTETAPIAWQEIGGVRIPVKVAFKVSDGLVGFEVASYDPKHSLIIDPIYEWHTFYGQAQGDEGTALAIDGSGNIYVAGKSFNSLTPGTWNGPGGQAPLHDHSGNSDIMVVKLNSQGAYQWHTFYGDGDRQWASGIALDGSGNVYVTGFTDGAQWLGDGNASPVRQGQEDGGHIVVLKLNTNGAYQWHTFYGYWVDEGYAVAVGGGAVYVTGYSSGEPSGVWVDMPAPIHDHSRSGYDMVVLKLNATSGAYVWHTFYGSASGDDIGRAIAVDGNGNAYVAGESLFTWQGDGNTSPLHGHSPPGDNGKPDIFVLKLNSSGAYQWHTFYGATYASPYWATGECGCGIALDSSGNIYVTGESNATWQGPAGQNPLHPYNAGRDITVLKLDTNGAYQWHTFYGSNGNNYAHAVAVNGNGVYVAGDGFTAWLGDNNRAPLHAHSSGSNHTILKLSTNGAYQWHTFYDGATSNIYHGIAADGAGNIFVSGSSDATWLGDNDINPLHAYTEGSDITVLRLNEMRTLTVDPSGTGIGMVTSSPAGIDCGSDCSQLYTISTMVTLTAAADPGSVFAGWNGGGCSGTGTCVVTIGDDVTVTATFNIQDGSGNLTPSEGTLGTVITITGSGYGDKKGKVAIGTAATKIISWTNTDITAEVKKVPPPDGPYDVFISTKTVGTITLDNAFTVMAPDLDDLADSSGASGDEITVTGNFFGIKKGKVYLDVGGGKKKNCKVTYWNMDPPTGLSEVRFIVPKVSKSLPAGNYPLNVSNKIGTAIADTDFTIEP